MTQTSDPAEDIDAIIALMLEYRAALPDGLYPEPEPEYARQVLLAWHADGDLLYELEQRDGWPVGCAVVILTDAWWRRDCRLASELVLYLRPQWRGSGTGWRMRRRLEARCRALGVASFETLHMNLASIEADDTAYRRAGYRLTGWAYERAL